MSEQLINMTYEEVLHLLEAPKDIEAIKLQAREEGTIHPDHGYARQLRVFKEAPVKAIVDALGVAREERTVTQLCAILARRKARSAVPLLCKLLQSPSTEIRAEAAEALGRIGGSRAGECLFRSFVPEQDVMVRQYIVLALGKMKYLPAMQLLADALGDTNSGVRAFAAISLGNLEDTSVIPYLSRSLADIDSKVQANATRALKRLSALVEGDS